MADFASGSFIVNYSSQLGYWPSGPSCLADSATASWAASSSKDALSSKASASIALDATVTPLESYLNFSGSFYSRLQFKVARLNSWVRLSSS